MLKIGNYNQLEVIEKTEDGYYLDSDKGDIFLPLEDLPEALQPGETVKVFVYNDSEDCLVATTSQPDAVVGEFAYLLVVDVTRIGAFLDWGLEKDLFVPFREQRERMKRGEKHIVRIYLDNKTNRLVASAKIYSFLDERAENLVEGQRVKLLIYKFTDLGVMAIVNHRFSGVLYRNEIFEKVQVGDSRIGYIKKIREEDGKIDLTLRPLGYAAVHDSKSVVLEKLVQAGGFLPYHDKSSPSEIIDFFNMSKKGFKKAIGGLYKEGKITISDLGIRLKK